MSFVSFEEHDAMFRETQDRVATPLDWLEFQAQIYRDKLKASRQETPIFTCTDGNCCDERWEALEKEVEQVISGVPEGSPAHDLNPMLVNEQINALYADLYLNNPNQKWAATAAIVSKQVGCTMKNNSLADNKKLMIGNVAIFKNIYPPLKMLETGMPPMSLDEMMACLESKLPKFDDPEKNKTRNKMMEGLEQIVKGNPTESAALIAEHEQRTIIQDAIYNDKLIIYQIQANQISGQIFADQSVYLNANCKKISDREVPFRSNDLNLWEPEDRVKFYITDFLPAFDQLPEREIKDIVDGIRNRGRTQ